MIASFLIGGGNKIEPIIWTKRVIIITVLVFILFITYLFFKIKIEGNIYFKEDSKFILNAKIVLAGYPEYYSLIDENRKFSIPIPIKLKLLLFKFYLDDLFEIKPVDIKFQIKYDNDKNLTCPFNYEFKKLDTIEIAIEKFKLLGDTWHCKLPYSKHPAYESTLDNSYDFNLEITHNCNEISLMQTSGQDIDIVGYRFKKEDKFSCDETLRRNFSLKSLKENDIIRGIIIVVDETGSDIDITFNLTRDGYTTFFSCTRKSYR